MADEQQDSPAPPPKPPRKRRRPAPTIELKATEVAVDPNEAAEPRQPDAARPEIPTSDAGSGAPPEEPPAFSPGADKRGRPMNWALVRAATGGVLAALLVFFGFWLAGALSRDDSSSAALSERLAVVETSVRDIASRPGPATSDSGQALDELKARLNKLEAASAAQPAQMGDPAIASRIAAIEEAVKSLQSNNTDFARRIDDNAAATREARGRADASLLAADAARAAVERSDIATVGNRIAALERTAKTLADEIAKSVAAAGDRPLRLAVAALALRTAVERGDPFTAELSAVKPLAPDAKALAPLAAFAASGVPTQAVLARQLSDLTPAMLRLADAPAATGGFLDRLQANAERLVRIRPIDDASGDDPVAIISRVEAKAARADIPGALTELAKLSAPVRAPAEEWIKKAEVRDAAVAASRRLASDALVALGKSP